MVYNLFIPKPELVETTLLYLWGKPSTFTCLELTADIFCNKDKMNATFSSTYTLLLKRRILRVKYRFSPLSVRSYHFATLALPKKVWWTH